ncbi:hypothetical protein ACH4JS_37005 [Streptomyces sp. NPDC017638]|uniref:hypothetical protein n=1 Tax=Streptomyces sp. NPDC017638 TaxID=3365004 RepID=UPI003795FADD
MPGAGPGPWRRHASDRRTTFVFDLVHAGANLTGWPYTWWRAALEGLFTDHRLEAPLTLCPSTTDRALADLLLPPMGAHPWQGWTFSAGWWAQRALDVVLVEPEVVLEVAVGVARDRAARRGHPVRPHRIRTDIGVAQVPLSGDDPAAP